MQSATRQSFGFVRACRLMVVAFAAIAASHCDQAPNPFNPHHSGSGGYSLTSGNGYPNCTNGSNTGGGYGWDPNVTDPNGSHSCVVPSVSTAANGYPYCTNGSNTGGGYGWDPSVTDPKGSHSCVAAGGSTVSTASSTSSTTTSTPATGANGYPYCTNGSNTGGGYGWDTSVTAPNGSHSCLVAGSTASTASSSSSSGGGSLPSLSLGVPANATFHISDYGSSLQTNKDGLAAAADAAGASAEEKALVIAIGMQETTHMLPIERDPSKDGTASANCSILNLNYDMLTKVGYSTNDNGVSLNNPANLSVAVGYLLKAFRTWGVQSTLNYQRGGSTAFSDGVSYGAADYRNAIQTIYNQIAADLSLESDGRRVEISVSHV